jgi:GNAT superfamily N-acetyltransferase
MSEVTSFFRLRDMQPGEQDRVRELTLVAYSQYATVMTPSAWRGLYQALLNALEMKVEAEVIVAEQRDSGKLLGSVMLFPPSVESYGINAASSAIPELRLLAVLPEARGRGVGQALVEVCVERARRWGASALGLHTSDSMAAAIKLYEQRGFVRVPQRDFQPPGAELVKAYQLELSELA